MEQKQPESVWIEPTGNGQPEGANPHGQTSAAVDPSASAPPPSPPLSPPPSPPPARGPGLRLILGTLLIFVLALALGAIFGEQLRSGVQSFWRHTADAHADAGGHTQYYTCGMHPWVLQPRPGLCPICQMTLEPVDPASLSGEVTISPVVVQNIGVRVEPVVTGPLVKTIRTVGTVDYAEPLVKDISTKIDGWIEKLYVDQMGQQVKADDPLFDLYSPELYAAQEEYLLAYRGLGRADADRPDDAPSANRQLLESARTKLEYFDITAAQIRALEQAGKPSKTMAIRSPHTGVVIEKNANEGMRIDSGMRVFRIADLSRVWVMVSIYEYQLPYVQEGQTAVMSLPYIPGQTLEGKVVYIYPYVSQQVREIKVRLEFDNTGGLLKPGMFANVELQNTLARDRVLAPRSAIIDTGKRQVAFVSLGDGRFEPRDIQVGVETEDGMVEIRDGLKPGEMVVTSGQFLLDSEARIREARAKMILGDMAADQQAVVAVSGHSELASLPAAAEQVLGRLLDHYLAIGQQLAGDSVDNTADPARQVAAAVDALLQIEIPENPHFWHQHEEAATVRGKALEIVSADGIEAARLAYADLSVALAKLLRATGIPPSYGQEVQQLHCPMYLEGQGGSTWLQRAGSVRNPFYGSRMLECFDKREALPVTGAAPNPSNTPDAATAPVEAPTHHHTTGAVDPAAIGHLDALVQAYLRLHGLLAEQDVNSVAAAEQFRTIQQTSSALAERAEGQPLALADAITRAAADVPPEAGPMRQAFAGISDDLLQLTVLVAPSTDAAPSLFRAYCPMVKKAWLQAGEAVSNPFDPRMPTCGTIEHPIAMQELARE